LDEEKMKNLDIKITNRLIKKLLTEDRIEIYREEDELQEENEILRNIVYAEILKGNYEKKISIYLEKEASEKNAGKDSAEIYHTEEIYKLPYSKNKKWLKISIKNAQKQWCTSYMNE
jgi:hypothetical protein